MKLGINILIAEDEPAILRGILACIRQFHDEYNVIGTAYNGKEALDLIDKKHPNIVITDIRMPFMDGLSMIKKARENGCQAHFIILTGFAEFSYARTALTLNVKDYLLKPIIPEELEAILHSLKQEIEQEVRQNQLKFIKNHFYKNKDLFPTAHNPLSGYHMYFLFCYYGPIVSNIYGEINQAGELANKEDLPLIDQVENHFSVFLYSFHGNYFNEHVYAVVFRKETSIDIHRIVCYIKDHILSEQVYINYVISEQMDADASIQEVVNNCYLYTVFHIPYAKSCILDCHQDLASKDHICVTKELQDLLPQLHVSLSYSSLYEFTKQFIEIWNKNETTQFQLTEDIHAILRHCVQQNPSFYGFIPNPLDIIANSYTYELLQENLLLELKPIFLIEDDSDKKDNAKDLVLDVKNYLDRNFTEPITYKAFSEIWGYNEKYITTLFKKAFSISPSKYIVNLRLSKAKELMRKNPNMLLKDMAESVGYTDALYFSRVFKNAEGISPSAYMKELKESN